MRATELVVGENYVLKFPHTTGVFVGRHEGELTLDDGTVYYGQQGYLRFAVPHGNGRRVVLLPSGADVEESVGAKAAREAKQLEAQKRRIAATETVAKFFAAHGFKTKLGYAYSVRTDPDAVAIREDEDVENVEIDGLTFGKLRRLVESGGGR